MTIWNKKDIKLFIILIPLINVINYFITYDNIIFNSYFLLTLFIDTVQGYLTWLVIRFIIIKMELRQPLQNFTYKRLFLQIVYTSLGGLFFIIFTTEILNAIVKDEPVPQNFYYLDIWIYFIWILTVNGIYIGMYYYYIWKNSEQKLQNFETLKNKGISVKIGAKNSKISIDAIAGFYVEDGLSFAIDSNFKNYIIESSLDNLEQKLPVKNFFRINRKFILHRNSITSFKKIENNKLLISTIGNGSIPNELILSRLKAAAFKKWFEKDIVNF
tara:strand:- start:5438 stop:6253 length:816 start_codon:yes stop_codon:yes gene_type:complete